MDWLIFWTILAQLGIASVAGIVFSFIIRLWTIWWPSSSDNDHNIFSGGNNDY